VWVIVVLDIAVSITGITIGLVLVVEWLGQLLWNLILWILWCWLKSSWVVWINLSNRLRVSFWSIVFVWVIIVNDITVSISSVGISFVLVIQWLSQLLWNLVLRILWGWLETGWMMWINLCY
jgi:hypothetical protein